MSNFLKIVNIFDILLIEYRNGTKSRLLLPLRQGDGKAVLSKRPAAGVLQKATSTTAPNHGFCCRCGNKTERQCRSEGLLQGYCEKDTSATAPNRGFCCRCGMETEGQCRSEGLLQGYCKKTLPQRHRFAGFAAVATWKRMGNAVQKAYCKGVAKKPLPQRHRITRCGMETEGQLGQSW